MLARPWHQSSDLIIGVMVSLTLHAIILMVKVAIIPPQANKTSPNLEVVLVNSKSESKPIQADALAQNNLDGGGNTELNKQMTTTTPVEQKYEQAEDVEQLNKQVKSMETQSRQMMTQLKSDYSLVQPNIPNPEPVLEKRPETPQKLDTDELIARAAEIARLEAQIDKQVQAYQKIPRRKFIGARTQEYRFSQYVEDWRVKVERIGNLNYPEQARNQKLYGKLVLSVSIQADGTLENVTVDKSSGHRLLDAAAVRIVRLAAPYTPLPPSITKDTDILTITRTWTFTPSNQLEGE